MAKGYSFSLPLITGIFIGAWLMYFLIRTIIFQEFSGLESAGNNSYIALRNELLDDLLLVPTFYMIPMTMLGVVGLVIGKMIKKQKKI